MGGAVDGHQRLVELGDHDIGRGERSGRPEVELGIIEIDAPLALLADLLGEIDRAPLLLSRAVGLFGPEVLAADPVRDSCREGDRAGIRVDRGDLDGGILPADAPLTLQPETVGRIPTGGLLLVLLAVLEGAGELLVPDHHGLLHRHIPLGGPARELHPLAVEEELKDPATVLEDIGEGARVLEAQRLEIGDDHLAGGFRGETLEHRGIGHRGEVRGLQHPAAGQTGLLLLVGAVDHGRTLGSGILRRELQAPGKLIDSSTEVHGDTPLGQAAGLLQLADLVSGACDRGKGARGTGLVGREPVVRIVTLRGDVELLAESRVGDLDRREGRCVGLPVGRRGEGRGRKKNGEDGCEELSHCGRGMVGGWALTRKEKIGLWVAWDFGADPQA